MKRTDTANQKVRATASKKSSGAVAKVHPVIIYPFKPARKYVDLEALYQLVARLDADIHLYARPITVLDRKTHYALDSDKACHNFRRDVVAKYTVILDVWWVVTFEMLISDLGLAFDQGRTDDVTCLITGDF